MYTKIINYVNQKKHLPSFLKDFHDQKYFFKALWKWQVENVNSDYLNDHTWISQHIYTIDVFLKFMAYHGYKLQKIRSDISCCDIENTLEDDIEERKKETTNLLQSALVCAND